MNAIVVMTVVTLMVYLSDDFARASTDFDTRRDALRVTPRTGMALVFEHPVRHQGAPVTTLSARSRAP